jgi:hypothetical protein
MYHTHTHTHTHTHAHAHAYAYAYAHARTHTHCRCTYRSKLAAKCTDDIAAFGTQAQGAHAQHLLAEPVGARSFLFVFGIGLGGNIVLLVLVLIQRLPDLVDRQAICTAAQPQAL